MQQHQQQGTLCPLEQSKEYMGDSQSVLSPAFDQRNMTLLSISLVVAILSLSLVSFGVVRAPDVEIAAAAAASSLGMPFRSILNADEDNRETQNGFTSHLMRLAIQNPLPFFNEELTRRVREGEKLFLLSFDALACC